MDKLNNPLAMVGYHFLNGSLVALPGNVFKCGGVLLVRFEEIFSNRLGMPLFPDILRNISRQYASRVIDSDQAGKKKMRLLAGAWEANGSSGQLISMEIQFSGSG